MGLRPGAVLLLFGFVAACAGRSEEAKETTRVTTDTLVETKQVVDTIVVRTDTTIVADTSIKSDTTKIDGE
jgi:hypothetical protein